MLLLAACQQLPEEQIQITDARAGATPPAATVAAAYMTIVATRADTLLSATTPVAERIEMHETLHEGGVTKMRPLTAVEIPSGGEFKFEPGGAHLMLVGLRSPLAIGSTVPMTLHFRHAGERNVHLEVVAPGATAH